MNNIYQMSIKKAHFAWAYHQIITDQDGNPTDYLLVDVNKAFCKFIGLDENDLIGKTFNHILPKIQNKASNWPDFYKQIAQHHGNIIFEHHDIPSNKWFKVHASSSENGFFTTIFEELKIDKGDLKKREILNKTLHLTKHSIDSISDSIFWIDKNAKIIYVNNAVCRNLKYSEQELLRMSVFYIDPLFPKENWENHWKNIEKHGSLTIETIHKTKRGLKISVEVTTNMVEYDGAKYNCAVARDISKRKLAEENLKNSELQFEAVFEKAADAIFIADAETGIILKANHAAGKLLLLPIEEIIGMHQTQLHPSQNKELSEKEFLQNIVELLKYDHSSRMESLIVNSNGDHVFVEVLASLVMFQGKNCLMGTFRDITERKLVQDKIESHASFLNSVLSSIPQPFAVINAKDYTIEMANEAYGGEQSVGRKCFEISHNIDVPCSGKDDPCPLRQIVKTKKSITVEHVHYDSDGKKINVEIQAYPVFDKNGEVYQIIEHTLDITERKKANELILQTRQNYETFFDTIDDFLFVLDLKGNIIRTNNAVINRLKYSAKELHQKPILWIHPKESDETIKKLLLEWQLGNYQSHNIPLLTKSGSQIQVESRVTQGFWNGNTAIFYVAKDISQIQLSEEKFSKVFYLNPSACGLSDLATGKYMEVNAAFESLFGYSKEEVIGKTAYELGIMNKDKAKHIVLKADENGSILNAEAELNAKGGRKIQVLLSAENISVQDKMMRYTVVNDITEIKQAQNAIEEKEKKYRELVESMSDGVYRSTHDGKFIEVNQALVRILGYDSKEDLLNIDIKTQLYFKEDDREDADAVQMQEEMVVFRLRKKDGSEIWVEDHGRHIFNEKGEILYHEGSLRDVTERKRANDQIKITNKELQKLNDEKDKFFSIIAHDLKSPFNSILGFSELLMEQLETQNLEGIARYVDIIHHSSHRAMNLLMNLMDWARSQTGRMEFNPEYFELVELINENVLLLDDSANQKSITIVKSIPKHVPIYADKAMISTILRNLITNAIKFSYVKSEILITVKEKGKDLIVSVKDHGVGIPNNRIQKLFRIDENISTPGTQNEKGTGLGLILCKEFVEKHQGKIWANSDPGSGSEFSFMIPILK